MQINIKNLTESKIFLIKYFLLSVISGLDFIMPYTILIFSKYLTPAQVAIVFVCQTSIKFILEIPTGALADRFGRKKTLLLGQASLILSITLLYFSKDFWICCLVMTLWGFCDTMFSGTIDSLFYDNMKYHNLHKNYTKYQIRTGIIFSAVSSLCFFGAGAIMKYYDNYNILILLFLVSLILYFTILASIKDHASKKLSKLNKDYFKILKQSLIYTFKHSTLLKLTIFSALFLAMYNFLNTYDGIYLKDITNSESMVGILFATDSIIAFFSAIILEKWINKQNIIGISRNFAIFSIFLVFAYTLYIFPYSWLLGNIFWMITIVSTNAFMAKKQEFIPSKLRATVNSISGMGFEIVKIGYVLSFGFLSEHISNKIGFETMGWVTFLICVIFYFVFKMDKHLNKKR
ncbi:MAG TPA: MFS transporter [Rickettsiales bacterium]|nr:MFS transporter [Rickettsiales bacterium]